MTVGTPARSASGEPPTNLPLQRTSFIGRDREIGEVARLLTVTRLLTLTGAGGCGKTRLALRVAREVAADFADGTWLVDLSAVTDPAQVVREAAVAVGARDLPGRNLSDSVVDYLRSRSMLILLDNCEHVITAAADLADQVTRACGQVRILATSREPLSSAGEITWRVPSLSVPPRSRSPGIEHLQRFEAVRLFLERARAARPELVVGDHEAPALAEICRQLDGIPLAIELAAARVRVFTIDQIATRLDDRFRLLTAGPRTSMPRQQTLRATVDWSFALLSEPERALLRRLSVFAGGWSFEAAEAVTAGDGIRAFAVLDLVSALVDKSLVVAEHKQGAAVRYRLLETIRQYARQRLDEAGESEVTRTQHLAYFLGLAEEAEPKLRGPHARVAMDRLEEEHDNLRLAIEWALQTDLDAALRLTAALGWFWWLRDYHGEARRWLARALGACTHRTPTRVRALQSLGWIAHHQRQSDEARAVLAESLSIAHELNDEWATAWALHVLGRVAYFENDPATARDLGARSLAVAENLGDPWLIAWALHLLGLAAYLDRDDAAARAHYTRSLAIRRELGYEEGIGVLLSLLGLVAVREGNLGEAHGLYRESLAVMRPLAGPWNLAMLLAAFARMAAAFGQLQRAARLGGAATQFSEDHETALIPLFEPLLAQGLAMARQALGTASFEQAFTEGRTMPLQHAVDEALAVEPGPPSARPMGSTESVRGAVGSLTGTELTVLRLLASGRTTKEIAAELVLAVSTVDRHITHVYGKLGARNRAEATAFASKHGLV